MKLTPRFCQPRPGPCHQVALEQAPAADDEKVKVEEQDHDLGGAHPTSLWPSARVSA